MDGNAVPVPDDGNELIAEDAHVSGIFLIDDDGHIFRISADGSDESHNVRFISAPKNGNAQYRPYQL